MAYKGIDVRATGDRILFRAALTNSGGTSVTTGTTSLYIFRYRSDGTLDSYDFNDNTFKTTALTTASVSMTARSGNNSTFPTGVWTYMLTTVSGFTVGDVCFALASNSGAIPQSQQRDFQYGSAEGDIVVTNSRVDCDATAISTSTSAADRLEAALTTANGIDLNMGQATPGSPTADTTGEALRFAHQDLPNQIAAGANGGLPTVNGSNYIAGIQGTTYHTLDDVVAALAGSGDSTLLVNTTATASSTTSQIFLAAVPGTDANDDYNGMMLIIYDASNSDRPSVHLISDYTATSNVCDITPTCRFTPANGDVVQVWAVTDSTLSSEILKLSTGFSETSPNNLNSYLKAMMSKVATVPAGMGTYDPATDSLEVLRERLDLMAGAGFSTSTDSLAALRDAFDALIAPSVVSSSTSLSGSGFISDCIGLVRRAVDEPSTNPKYTNADILEFIQGAFDVLLADVTINTDHPVLVRYTLNIESGKQNYTLPPNVAQVWRVAKRNSQTGLIEWEVWPGNEFSFHGRGFTIEGETFRLVSDWLTTDTMEILYVPNSEVFMHKATADAITDTTITFPSSVTDGTLDTRKNAYAGYMVRLLDTSVGRVEERMITAYDNTTGVATISEEWDETPTIDMSNDVIYEVVPQFSRLMKHLVVLRAAIDLLAQEGNSKRMSTLNQPLLVKMTALRRYLQSKNMRFPHSATGDTADNLNRGWWGGEVY